MRQFGKLLAKSALLGAVLTLSTGVQTRLGDFDQRVLAVHNEERAQMGVSPLAWDPDLADNAQEWAEHLARTGRFEHSPNRAGEPLEGENIWGGTVGAYAPESMVGLWIAEKQAFVKGVFPANSRTGRVQDVSHYTQLVWQQTRKVGCGMARGEREEIMVCRYSSPGNVLGRRPL
ncbi:CAP family protein [Erythrobacter sp. LQ02-29]|uniref:CAP family protein n=1 Tax=Erythrobacter sp. LQ02-29 TaxID=2920384 RepID=UPI001F4E2320|nr:CAP family protein [Erythrobacter sp. LQ02-29]MCP9223557.1 CAP family protein [Erythrobacter sp. LQ02-29]